MPSGNLTVLLGYGPNAFRLADARRPLPDDLDSRNQFRSPRPTGGGPLLVGAGLWYAEDVRANLATEEMAVQFIADTQLAVNRTIVETWKFLHDAADPDTGAAPCS